MKLREITGQLFRVWLSWTLFFVVVVAVIGLVYGTGRPLRLALVGAGLADVWVAAGCVKSWLFAADYRWFWWRR